METLHIISHILELLLIPIEATMSVSASEPMKMYRCEAACYYHSPKHGIEREQVVSENYNLSKAWRHLEKICDRKDEIDGSGELQFHPANWDNNSDQPEFIEATPELSCQ